MSVYTTGLGYFLVSYSLKADGSTHWDSFFYISIPNSNGTGNFVPSYNYTDETGLKFLLEGNISINVQYSTGHGSKVGLLCSTLLFKVWILLELCSVL